MTARTAPALRVTEAAFQEQLIDLAQLTGWRAMHVRRSRVRDDRHATATSIAGWPDLALFNPKRGEFFVAELKSEAGRLSSTQRACLDDLAASGVEVHVWRPSSWPEVVARLRGSAS